jgi:hypothetical protein
LAIGSFARAKNSFDVYQGCLTTYREPDVHTDMEWYETLCTIEESEFIVAARRARNNVTLPAVDGRELPPSQVRTTTVLSSTQLHTLIHHKCRRFPELPPKKKLML